MRLENLFGCFINIKETECEIEIFQESTIIEKLLFRYIENIWI